MTTKIVRALSELPDFSQAKYLVLDTETSGLNLFHGDRLSGIALSALDHPVNYFIPVRHNAETCSPVAQTYQNLPAGQVFGFVQELLNDPSKTVIGHHFKFDLNVLRFENITNKRRIVDTLVLAHILQNERPHKYFSEDEEDEEHPDEEEQPKGRDRYALDLLTKDYIPEFKHVWSDKLENWFKEFQPRCGKGKKQAPKNYSRVPLDLMGEYACEDIEATKRLFEALKKIYTRARRAGCENFGNLAWTTDELFQNEMKLITVLAKMEWNGVKLDLEKCEHLKRQATDEMETFREALFSSVGRSFNPTAWKQRWTAYEQIGGVVKFWNAKKEFKGKQKEQQYTEDKSRSTGRPCWNAAARLAYLKHFRETKDEKAFAFVLNLHEYENRRGLIATFLDAFLKGADVRGYIHTTFNQHGTWTGRLSSSGPNLQNIAKTKGTLDQKLMESFLGAKNSEALNRKLRTVFIAEPGELFLKTDYNQAEYRGTAYFCHDEELFQKYRTNPMLDYHEDTAKLAGIDRDDAKTVNFSSIYGVGVASLAALLRRSKAEAQGILNALFCAKPALRQLMNEMQARVRRDGYVQNPFGRVVPVDAEKAYKGLNALVQGTIGDMARAALVELDAFLEREKLPVILRLTVHDEFDTTTPRECVNSVVPKIQKVISNVPQLASIPMLCDTGVGLNWGENKPFEEEAV